MPIGVCRLCKDARPLCDSHLLPKAAYRLIRKTSGASPVVATRGLVRASDLQVRQYLLCERCEERFSGPERYALSQCCRGRRFQLQELLATLMPLQPNPDAELIPYATAGVAGLDLPSLVYFASSLLWRASVAVWRMANDVLVTVLGRRYNDLFHRFLLGEIDFPDDAAIWISVTKTRNPHLICVGPHLHNKTTHHQFEMQVFGVRWSIFVGRQIHATIRRMCSLRSPERFIYLSDSPFDLAMRGAENLIRTTHIADNLRGI